MNFIVSSTALQKGLQTIAGVIQPSNTLPILDNFLFQIENNRLKITGTDLETTLTTEIEIKSDDEGSLAVPSKLLFDTVKSFPEQPLSFRENKEKSTLDISSEQGDYQIAYESADGFPDAPAVEDSLTVSMPSAVLQEALSKTVFATGSDDLRPVMTGVFFELDAKQLRFVATDAHRLVQYTRTDLAADQTAEFIVPKKSLNLLRNALPSTSETVNLEYTESNARFSWENHVLTCRLIDGKYPNYNAVIPKENPNVLTVNRPLFLSSLRRVALFANKSTNQVRLNLAGSSLTLNSEDTDFSSKANENLPVDYNGEDLQIGFNSKFLIEMLNNLQSEDVTLEMSQPSRAGILKPADGKEEGEDILMLVMPVMIGA